MTVEEKSHSTVVGKGNPISEEEYLEKRDDGNIKSTKAFFGKWRGSYTDYHVRIIPDEKLSDIEKKVIKEISDEIIYNLHKDKCT